MLKLPSMVGRSAILLGIFLGVAGPGLAATTAPLAIRVLVQRSAVVTALDSEASIALRGGAEVVDASGRPVAVPVQFMAASAPPGVRFVTVLADGGPLAPSAVEEEAVVSPPH
jgi:hypothetical protein